MKKLLTILGPTASGKTALAAKFCANNNGEIISADSRQVYRRMDIGTGKDIADYCVGKKRVPFHIIDIVEPGTRYNVFEYQKDFFCAYSDIINRGKLPVMCGGSGLYIEAVLGGYKLMPVPENKDLRRHLETKSLSELSSLLVDLKAENGSNMHNITDIDTAKRAIRAIEIETYYKEHGRAEGLCFPGINSIIIGIDIGRDERRRKISARLRQRLADGMVDEIKGLLAEGIAPEDLTYYGLEYKYLTLYVTGKLTFDEMYKGLEIAIHQFAKRQMTWFRGMERRGLHIHWLDGNLPLEEKVKRVVEMLAEK